MRIEFDEYSVNFKNMNENWGCSDYRVFVDKSLKGSEQIMKAIRNDICHENGMMLDWLYIRSMKKLK